MKYSMLKPAAILSSLLLLAGCGTSTAESFPVSVDTYCDENGDTTAYTRLRSGDVITRASDDTIVAIYHNQDNEKFICLESGSATILRTPGSDHGLVK